MAELTAESKALLANFEFVHKWLIEQALGARDKFEQEEWADIIGSDPGWRVKEALPGIEAAAVRDWLASPEAEKALAAALTNLVFPASATRTERARAILAALREPPREGSA